MAAIVTGYIDDGYNLETQVTGRRGLFPDVWIEFRPMLSEQVGRYLKEVERLDSEQTRKSIARIVSEQVQRWDVRNVAGEIVPISAADCRKLQPLLLERLFAIVTGQDGGDPRGERERTDAKNSSSG